MNMRIKKLNELFNVYNKSLITIRPKIGETFICPICLQEFGRNTIDNGDLTIEHIPPQSIGSSIETMTCRTCNNKIGSKLQNQMKNYVTKQDISIGQVPERGIPAYAEINDKKLNMVIKEVIRDKQGKTSFKSFSDLTHNAPQVWPSNADEIINKKIHISLRLKSSNDAVCAAYLHSAYLALFNYLGYPYIMQPVFDPIRQKIASLSTKGVIPHVIHVPGLYLNPRDKIIEINLLWQSLDISCFAVVIAGELVIMPFFNDSYIKLYEILYDACKAKSEGRNIDISKCWFGITPLIIDINCRYFTSFQFVDGGRVFNNIKALKLAPNPEGSL